MRKNALIRSAGILMLAALIAQAPPALGEGIADMSIYNDVIEWYPYESWEEMVLTLSGPDGFYWQDRFEAGEMPVLPLYDAIGSPLPDGSYRYELSGIPHYTSEHLEDMALARESDDPDFIQQVAATLPLGGLESGEFGVAESAFVPPGEIEGTEALSSPEAPATLTRGGQLATRTATLATGDAVIRDSLCVGHDCPARPSFGFSTLLLNENNLRLKFDDSSTSGSYPRNDWTLEANSSSNGGSSHFAVIDASAGRPVFTVEAGARRNAIHVDSGSQGGVGLGTSTPAVTLHVTDGDSPTLRLAQDGSSGFQPQTWDLVGNEANFFVRDVGSEGTTLPFRVFPETPTNTLTVSSPGGGRVGIGTSSPDSSLHVRGTDGDTAIHVHEASTTAALRPLFNIENNGGTEMRFIDNDLGRTWSFRTAGNNFVIDSDQSPGTDMRLRGSATNASVTLEILGAIKVAGTTLSVPDYVFEDDYDLLPLAELRRFVESERHLPEVPSAQEIRAGGLDIGELGMQLLRKVEELTLYTLDQQETIEAQKSVLAAQTEAIEALKAQLEALAGAAPH